MLQLALLVALASLNNKKTSPAPRAILTVSKKRASIIQNKVLVSVYHDSHGVSTVLFFYHSHVGIIMGSRCMKCIKTSCVIFNKCALPFAFVALVLALCGKLVVPITYYAVYILL